jgi:hypothetical protein
MVGFSAVGPSFIPLVVESNILQPYALKSGLKGLEHFSSLLFFFWILGLTRIHLVKFSHCILVILRSLMGKG